MGWVNGNAPSSFGPQPNALLLSYTHHNFYYTVVVVHPLSYNNSYTRIVLISFEINSSLHIASCGN